MKIQAVLLLAGMGVMEHAVAETPRNPISVHVLNTQTGKPSQGVNVDLEQQQGGKWVRLASKTTDVDGRIPAFILTAKTLPLASIALPSIPVTISTASKRDFLPDVPVNFRVTNTQEHYHIPLLLSQYGFPPTEAADRRRRAI